MNKSYEKKVSWAVMITLVFFLTIPLVKAQVPVCTAAPSCSELGFVQSMADCAGVEDVLKCPFDTGKVFCLEEVCTPTDCSSYTLASCPWGGVCSSCVSGCGNTTTKHKLDRCDDGYTQFGNNCNCSATLDACPANAICTSCDGFYSWDGVSCEAGYTPSNASCWKETCTNKYLCTGGGGYIGGSGTGCGSPLKYNSCICSSGYAWTPVAKAGTTNGACYSTSCNVYGSILYSDKTCSSQIDPLPGKTVIGIVFNPGLRMMVDTSSRKSSEFLTQSVASNGCKNLTSGYVTWRLPTSVELGVLRSYKATVNASLQSAGAPAMGAEFWTSNTGQTYNLDTGATVYRSSYEVSSYICVAVF